MYVRALRSPTLVFCILKLHYIAKAKKLLLYLVVYLLLHHYIFLYHSFAIRFIIMSNGGPKIPIFKLSKEYLKP